MDRRTDRLDGRHLRAIVAAELRAERHLEEARAKALITTLDNTDWGGDTPTPVGTLPSGLEAFVDVNPISHLVTAARGLMEGNPDGGELAISPGTAAVLTAVFAP